MDLENNYLNTLAYQNATKEFMKLKSDRGKRRWGNAFGAIKQMKVKKVQIIKNTRPYPIFDDKFFRARIDKNNILKMN